MTVVPVVGVWADDDVGAELVDERSDCCAHCGDTGIKILVAADGRWRVENHIVEPGNLCRAE